MPHSAADALVWAARAGAPSAEVYNRWAETDAAKAVGAPRAKGRLADVLNRDKYRVAARARRRPVKRAAPRAKATLRAGHTWHIDHYPHDVASPVDGSTGQYLAVCEATDYGYAKNVKTHSAEDLAAFVRRLRAKCRRYGRCLRAVVLDRGAENACDGLRDALAALDIDVEVAPRGHHERVACVEAKQDVLSRNGDAQLRRARQSRGYHLQARLDFLDRLNDVPARGQTKSRAERFTGAPRRSLKETPPYVYGVRVNVLEDEQARGAHQGKGHQGRSSEGLLLRCARDGYMVVKESTGKIVYPRHVTPLDEQELVARGLPPEGVLADKGEGTPSDGIPLAPPPPPPPAAAPPKPAPFKTEGVPVGSRIEVLYAPSKAAVKAGAPDALAYYPGAVVEIRDSATQRHHLVKFDGESQPIWHNLADARGWRMVAAQGARSAAQGAQPTARAQGVAPRASPRLKAASDGITGDGGAASPAAPPPKAPRAKAARAAPPADGPSTRLRSAAGRPTTRARSAHLTQALDAAMSDAEDPVALFAACAFQWCGDAADSIEHPSSLKGVPAAMRSFYQWELSALSTGAFSALSAGYCTLDDSPDDGPSAMKAAGAKEVLIPTALGERVLKVPKTQRDVEHSLDKDEWMMGLQRGVDAVLVQPKNKLVRISKARASGTNLAECTVVFTAKTDKATGALTDNWAKVRCCFDESKAKGIAKAHAKRTGTKVEKPAEPFASVVADGILVRCILAQAATGRRLTKADVKDAYSKGLRRGAVRYMRMPRLMRQFTEDGEELVFELGAPMWGEDSAGRDWQDTLHADLLAMGWRPAENVPALYTFADAATGENAVLTTVVDDLLISESGDFGPYTPPPAAAAAAAVGSGMPGLVAAADDDTSPGRAGPIAERTIAALRAKYGTVTSETEPTSFVGKKLDRDWATAALTISMPRTIEAFVDEHYPEFKEGKPAGILSGKALQEAADSLCLPPPAERPAKLSASQTKTRRVTGALKWQEGECKPRLAVGCHRLACVMACPPPIAAEVARALAWWSWTTREEGITYGGRGPGGDLSMMGAISAAFSMDDGAPEGLHLSGDATWRANPVGPPDVIGLLATLNYGGVGWNTKLSSLILDSSHEQETIASAKAGELNAYCREITRALGIELEGPTEILTDNLANQIIASKSGWPTRSRHFMRRYHSLLRRVEMGECVVRKVTDAENPSDFLTKWLSATKLNRSVAYVENAAARVGGRAEPTAFAMSRAEQRARRRLHEAGFGADGAPL